MNQNFGTICHTEVYLTFSRLGAKLSGAIAKERCEGKSKAFSYDAITLLTTLSGVEPSSEFFKGGDNDFIVYMLVSVTDFVWAAM